MYALHPMGGVSSNYNESGQGFASSTFSLHQPRSYPLNVLIPDQPNSPSLHSYRMHVHKYFIAFFNLCRMCL